MTLEEELMKCLESVKDTYSDFVYGGMSIMKTDSDKTAVINYIKSNPNTTTSDVITKFSELLGIFPQN